MKRKACLVVALLAQMMFGTAMADGRDWGHGGTGEGCVDGRHPVISFVEIQTVDLSVFPPAPLTLPGKLKIPVRYSFHDRCYKPAQGVGAVVILHGSIGIDSRGDFYAEALNAAGLATLEVDMWGARGVVAFIGRPQLPILTYPDAFASLGYLSQHEAVDPARIGVLGFSWGAVISLAAAEQAYAWQFGEGLKFAAHVANYPTCYGANSTIPALMPNLEKGTQFLNPTGAPVLIQIGTQDDYDNGAEHCLALAEAVNSVHGEILRVNVYEGASHAWDRLLPPTQVADAFGDEGSIFTTGVAPMVDIVPDVDAAYLSRGRVVRFFKKALAASD